MRDSVATEPDEFPWKLVLGGFTCQAAGLAVAGWIHRHALNPDGVAYLRIASYYASGQADLAISGYWGPLLSWLMVPFFKAGLSPLATARVVMAISAVVFLSGVVRLYCRFGIRGSALTAGVWLAAAISIPWSVENVTPDLLLAGLTAFAVSGSIGKASQDRSRCAFGSGLLWGVAYLCKAVALPLALIVGGGMALWDWGGRSATSRMILGRLGVFIFGLALVSIPWIAVISSHYGKLTISNAALLNHSLMGPTVTNRLYLLDRGFHQPQSGRITSWEDPGLPYPPWSAFASGSNAARQIKIIIQNVPIVLVMLCSVSLIFPFLVGRFLRLWLNRGTIAFDSNRAVCAALPIAGLVVLLLPNYLLITEQRYLYLTFPLFYVLSVGAWSSAQCTAGPLIRRFGFVLLAGCFLVPTFARAIFRPGSTRTAGEVAWSLAERIQLAKVSGTVAGSGRLPGGRTGLYLAFHLNQPWLGDEPSASAEHFIKSGAKLIVVNRGTAAARDLELDTQFHNLDAQLFDSPQESHLCPVQIFEANPP